MSAIAAIYRNPPVRASGKTGRASVLKLAARVALQVGIVRTWSNLQTIRLAIESEAALSEVSPQRAADVIVESAREYIRIENPLCPDWARREVSRLNSVDRFWFEDARWRQKSAYEEFRAELRETRLSETA